MSQEKRRRLGPLILLILGGALAAQAQPLVSLGPDRLVCGSDTLDAGNPGAAYLWSTGETTQSIIAAASGLYWVEVSNANGTTRDSLNLTVLLQPSDPVTTDTSRCGPGVVPLVASFTGETVLWYGQPTGGSILNYGSPAQQQTAASTTYYAQSIATPPPISLGPATNVGVGTSGTYSNGNGRGFVFQAFQDIIIKSVSVYPQASNATTPLNVTIELRNSSNVVLASRSFSFVNPAQVKTELPLWFSVPTGTNYRLVVNNLTGGLLYLNFNVPLASYQVPGVARLISGTPTVGDYFFLYDWKLAIPSNTCTSARVALAADIFAQPVVNLGRDTILCGGAALTLNAFNAGAQYAWSTGASDSAISVSTTGLYSVTASIGNCIDQDSIQVSALATPGAPLVSDTFFCGPGAYSLAATASGSAIWWQTSPQGQIAGEGSAPSFFIGDTTTYYVSSANYLTRPLGPPANIGVGTSGAYSNGDGRGLVFQAFQDLIIESVSVYPQASNATTPLKVTIELRNSSNVVLASRSFSFVNPAQVKTKLPLWFAVPVGTNYRLVINNLTGGLLYLNFNVPMAPYQSPGLARLISTTPNSTDYYFLYDWQLLTENTYCQGPASLLTAHILEEPSVSLGSDTLLCGGDSLLLNATYPGASYQWSTGAVSSAIWVDSAGTYIASASLGACSASDTIAILTRPLPPDASVTDTFLCAPGEILLQVDSLSAATAWYNSPVGGQILAQKAAPSFFLQDTSTFYIQRINDIPLAVGPSNNSIGTSGTFSSGDGRGLRFDAFTELIIRSVHVYPKQDIPGEPITFDIELRNSSGQVVASRPVFINTSSNAKREVPVWFQVPQGLDYRLVINRLEGGLLYLNANTSSLYPQYSIPGVMRIFNSTPQNNDYFFFYDWRVLTRSRYCASARVPLTVSVKLPLSLPDYIYACDDTLISAGNFPGAFTWGGGQQGPSLLVEESGIYSLAVTDNAGCFAFDTVEVEIPRTAGLQDDGILCGNTLITNYDETANFLWSTGDTSATLTISQPGVYSVAVAEPRGCFLRDTITVTGFDVFPTVSLGPDVVACDSAELDAGNPGFSFLWSTGDTTQVLTVFSSGAYEVVVTNSNECASRDTVGVLISQRPVADFFVPDTVYSGDLSVTFFNFSGLGSYRWDLGDGTTSSLFEPEHTYVDTGFYCVELIVTDIISGCGRDTFERCFTLLRYPLSLDPAAGRGWLAYPNPARDALFLRWQAGSSGLLRVELINAMGQVLLQRDWLPQGQEPLVLPVGALARGLYVLRVSGPEGSSSQPLMLRY